MKMYMFAIVALLGLTSMSQAQRRQNNIVVNGAASSVVVQQRGGLFGLRQNNIVVNNAPAAIVQQRVFAAPVYQQRAIVVQQRFPVYGVPALAVPGCAY